MFSTRGYKTALYINPLPWWKLAVNSYFCTVSSWFMTVYCPSLLRQQGGLQGARPCSSWGLGRARRSWHTHRGCAQWCQQVPQLEAQTQVVLPPGTHLRRVCHLCLVNRGVKEQGVVLPLLFMELLTVNELKALCTRQSACRKTSMRTLLHLILGHIGKSLHLKSWCPSQFWQQSFSGQYLMVYQYFFFFSSLFLYF